MVTHNRNRQNISNKGRVVDWERLRSVYANTPAVGNVPMNTRGDILGPGGNVVKTAEQVEEEYNQAYEQQMQTQGGGSNQQQSQMSIKRDAIPKGRQRQQPRDDQMVTPPTPEQTEAYSTPEEALEKAKEKATRGSKNPQQEQDTTQYQKPEDVVQKATERKKEEQKNKPDFTEGAMDPSQAAEGLPDVDPTTGESKSSSKSNNSRSRSNRKIVDSDQ